MVMICPLVMSWAIPRPATIRINVATIGWILSLETSIPFHKPQSMPAAKSARTMIGNGVCVIFAAATELMTSLLPSTGLINTAPIAAEIAITAPTERSTPPVAITNVIPIATNMSGAPSMKMSMILPYK